MGTGTKNKKEQSEASFTICRECFNFMNVEPGTARENIWYNHLCVAVPLPLERDPYDGEMKPIGSRHDYAYCRDINDRHCSYFVRFVEAGAAQKEE